MDQAHTIASSRCFTSRIEAPHRLLENAYIDRKYSRNGKYTDYLYVLAREGLGGLRIPIIWKHAAHALNNPSRLTSRRTIFSMYAQEQEHFHYNIASAWRRVKPKVFGMFKTRVHFRLIPVMAPRRKRSETAGLCNTRSEGFYTKHSVLTMPSVLGMERNTD